MLKQRLIFGSILIASLIGVFALDHYTETTFGFTGILFIVAAMALHEFYTMHEIKLQTKLPKYYGIVTGLIVLSIPVTIKIIFSYSALSNFTFITNIFITLAILSIPVLMTWCLAKGNPDSIQNIYVMIFGLVYICGPLYLLYMMRVIFNGETFFYLLIVLNKTADTGAYFGGKYLGKHKLSPTISPNKTVEGLICALLTGLIVGQLFWSFTGLKELFTYPAFIILVFFMALSGQIGDLVESMIKRYCGVKDSGTLFPGLGGILDLIDCLLASAFITFIIISILSRL
jgi:phosphatidate cytidylyltransferase